MGTQPCFLFISLPTMNSALYSQESTSRSSVITMTTLPCGPNNFKRPLAKPRRRQNHCCDQCRRSKRACDATGRTRSEVCSNCTRTGKVCTFEKVLRTTKEKSTQSIEENLPWANTVESHVFNDQKPPVSCPSLDFTEYSSSCTTDLQRISPDTSSAPDSNEMWLFMTPTDAELNSLEDANALSAFPESIAYDPAPLGYQGFGFENSPSSILSLGGTDQSSTGWLGPPSQDQEATTEDRPSSLKREWPHLPDPSSDAPVYLLAERTNKSLISDSLTKIYHDTMENALSCWVTERTCPYTYEGIVKLQPQYRGSPTMEYVVEGGNRITARICLLDRPTCTLRERPLTKWENTLASRALKAAIMAFSSQWAKTSTYERIDYGINQEDDPSSFDRSLQETLWNEANSAMQEAAGVDSFRVTFAQLIFSFIQKPLNRAQYARAQTLRAQQGITPRLAADTDDVASDSMTSANIYYRQHTSQLHDDLSEESGEIKDLQDLLDLQGRPMHLDNALLRLSARRVKLEEMASGRQSGSVQPVSINDRKTFNLLFWMVMMCDTLVASLYQRPFIVSDEDSLILRADDPSRPPEVPMGVPDSDVFTSSSPLLDNDDSEFTPWGMRFLKKGETNMRATRTTWPFSPDHAAGLLSDAAQVKVLLYRRVKRLRNFLFRRSSPKTIETGIVDALSVYEHWNKTYGDFMVTCLKHHEDLSPQLQSWYAVLLGHWQLAVFLLSDCIEEVDRNQKGDRLYGALRQSCRLVFEMRKSSAFQVAELCRVARPRAGSSFNQIGDYHSSVSQGALLTEPWTEILIRCFARASDHFLKWLSDLAAGTMPSISWTGDSDRATLRNNCAECIEGLFDLGCKSDVAYLTALSISRRLQRLEHLAMHAHPQIM